MFFLRLVKIVREKLGTTHFLTLIVRLETLIFPPNPDFQHRQILLGSIDVKD